MFERIKKETYIDPKKLVCANTDGTVFNFNSFKASLDLASNIYNDKNLLKNAEYKQHNMKVLLRRLEKR